MTQKPWVGSVRLTFRCCCRVQIKLLFVVSTHDIGTVWHQKGMNTFAYIHSTICLLMLTLKSSINKFWNNKMNALSLLQISRCHEKLVKSLYFHRPWFQSNFPSAIQRSHLTESKRDVETMNHFCVSGYKSQILYSKSPKFSKNINHLSLYPHTQIG